MGLDQYAGFRDSKGEVHEEFYWRKHARLQVFFAKQWNKQNNEKMKEKNFLIILLTTCNIWASMVGKVVSPSPRKLLRIWKRLSRMVTMIILLMMDFSGDNNFRKSKSMNTRRKMKNFLSGVSRD